MLKMPNLFLLYICFKSTSRNFTLSFMKSVEQFSSLGLVNLLLITMFNHCINCGRISLIVIICNVADPIDCESTISSPSEIWPFGWQLYLKKLRIEYSKPLYNCLN